MNNEELSAQLSALRSGDINAFEKIYTELKTPVYIIIVRITGDNGLAEDILQEVFIKLYHSPPADDVHNPRAYICKMARNFAIDGLRKLKVNASLDELEDTVQAPEHDFEFRMDAEAAMRQLPATQRQIVSLRINCGLKFREIADITEEPLGTVLYHYQAAVSKLRKYLSGGAL
ncbi:MAG: sigma-70 family RNA polymerase sigma factor [Clostridiales bacterium]|jgi:RNA polymerase sigma-70 factor (ECF subfamily)|nr:sigma-70 family RNA polymerase sigma factor [Clostridiales bacterium]